jgi:5'-deoxynucleotidase YfbR-like HD superfamily hydrolase
MSLLDLYTHRLDAFVGRDADLRAIERYNLYKVMYYRTNLEIHSKRVASQVLELSSKLHEIFGNEFLPDRAITTALVHDDAEIVFGDVQAGNKSKMTEAQLAEVVEAEKVAIAKIGERLPKSVGEYVYTDLLQSMADVTTTEAKIVKFIDKYDAFGEALHEVYGGNQCFTTNVVNEYGTIPIPPDYYVSWITKFHAEEPELASRLKMVALIFAIPETLDWKELSRTSKPHTRESLSVPTGYAHYDWWKNVIRKYDPNEDANLLIQKEFAA